jgi:hypothetical protein
MDEELDGEQEVVCVQDETCQSAPPEPAEHTERHSFNNQPLKSLENLKLF